MSTVIVGAGVTGLTVALKCLEQGEDVVVLEKDSVAGGLCRTYDYGDFLFDIGPHRLYSPDPSIDSFFLAVLGDAHVGVPRVSQVKLNGNYHDWPLRFGSALTFPPKLLARCAIDFLSRRGNGKPHASLEDYVRSTYGQTIYETFWRDYTAKFVGIPCSEVDASWGALSVNRSVVDKSQRPGNLLDLVRSSLSKKDSTLHFIYPTGGMGRFPDAMVTQVKAAGRGSVKLNQTVRGIRVENGCVRAIDTDDASMPVDRLIWTAPITQLADFVGVPVPRVQYLDMLLFNVMVDKALPGKWQWIYFPCNETVFSRISRPDQFHPAMAPENATGLCVEVSVPGGPPDQAELAALTERIYDELLAVRMVPSRSAIIGCEIEHVPYAYPVYRKGFRPLVDATHAEIAAIDGLEVVGRQAMFDHDNIDEAVASAFELCKGFQTVDVPQ